MNSSLNMSGPKRLDSGLSETKEYFLLDKPRKIELSPVQSCQEKEGVFLDF